MPGENRIVVVAVSPGDERAVTALRALVAAYVATWYQPGEALSAADRELLRNLPGPYAPPHGAAWVAQVSGLPAGCLLAAPTTDGALELRKMYVDPPGRGHGLGRALLEAAATHAAATGRHHLVLAVHRGRHAALGLYRSAGFVERAGDVDGFLQMSRAV